MVMVYILTCRIAESSEHSKVDTTAGYSVVMYMAGSGAGRPCIILHSKSNTACRNSILLVSKHILNLPTLLSVALVQLLMGLILTMQ